MNHLEQRVADEIRRRGPVPFSEVMDLALYDPEHGFYASGGTAGRRGDFITSAEVGPLFGAVVARALDEGWRERGEPDPFVVIEAGAGAGTLAITVLSAQPACAPALRYVLVERSAALRARQAEHLSLEDPALAFAPDRAEDEDGDIHPPEVATGPIVVSLDSMPRLHGSAFVLANELLDNLPFDVLERRDGQWHEVRVGLQGDALVETLVPADGPDIDAADGARVPVQTAAARWVRDARECGTVVAFDYADTTASMASREASEWLRTYKGHRRGRAPLRDLGSQDITCEVAVDQLPAPTRVTAQATWLRAHGIDELVEEGKRIWQERKHIGDLEAVRARSRVNEATSLTDPASLGGFAVLEWD
jgi:NADH dehydrogenase [ubiquinone] 1 alpha subcomplex assembly factor 7